MSDGEVMLGVMQIPIRPFVSIIVLVALACGAPGSAEARGSGAERSRSCPGVAAVVVARSATEAREACGAIARAAEFLERQGVTIEAPIELHLVDALPPQASTSTRAGAYLREQRRAYVLRRSRWPADPAPFGLPMTRALYRSAIVHEAVHAIVADHFRSTQPDVVAHEYLAYVAQLDSLEPSVRKRALRGGPPHAGDVARRLNLFVLGMNPDRFAVLAWYHWSEPGNGAAFVHALLEGEALLAG